MASTSCPDCDGTGTVYDTRPEFDSHQMQVFPVDIPCTCPTCEGSGEVPLICPECQQPCDELVDAGFSDYKWCLACALESIESYSDEQAQAIREKAGMVTV